MSKLIQEDTVNELQDLPKTEGGQAGILTGGESSCTNNEATIRKITSREPRENHELGERSTFQFRALVLLPNGEHTATMIYSAPKLASRTGRP